MRRAQGVLQGRWLCPAQHPKHPIALCRAQCPQCPRVWGAPAPPGGGFGLSSPAAAAGVAPTRSGRELRAQHAKSVLGGLWDQHCPNLTCHITCDECLQGHIPVCPALCWGHRVATGDIGPTEPSPCCHRSECQGSLVAPPLLLLTQQERASC